MMKLFAVFCKEWTLLFRDKVGLIFLFLLPMCLVLFITLTSGDVGGDVRSIKIMVLNNSEHNLLARALIKALKKVDDFNIVVKPKVTNSNLQQSKNAILSGEYQALLVIPKKFSHQTSIQLHHVMQNKITSIHPATIDLFFDPAVSKIIQNQIVSGMQLILKMFEIKFWQNIVLRNESTDNIELFSLHQASLATAGQQHLQINEVQQNVPAWALFGMFFIITPLSGIIVKERRLGVMSRLNLAPVSLVTLVWGKIFAFVCINLLQLILMLAVGVLILPWFGLPVLNVTDQPLAILVVGCAASLAATGFGMLIGSLVRTAEQANVIGPFLIVIAAAVGGIFVPIYLLPEALQKIANLSPMHWALQAFIDIFVRNANITLLWQEISKLLCFAIVTIGIVTLIFNKSKE